MDATTRVVLSLCVLLFVAQVRSSHIPKDMNRTIENLRLYYKIPVLERYNGKPVFSREPLSGDIKEVKKVYLGGILEMYGKLFNKMLDQLPTPGPSVDSTANADAKDGSSDTRASVRTGLKYIREMVHKLKGRYREQVKVVDELKSLQNIETDNSVNQGKALRELMWLYEEASSLLNDKEKKRRRRQTLAKKKE
ncbi:interferon gamma-like [Eucyclogobius newberryi]|uniref:interferon gamma-like n=1 Tax=Eucyclogobius newberryi TaxID=166745 RepID=UPI003B5B2937